MELFIVSLSILFIVIGFVFTESNTNYLLNNYSSLSKIDKSVENHIHKVRFFRTFHIFLAISLLVIGLSLLYVIDENAAGIFAIVYPMLAYLFYLLIMRKKRFEQYQSAINLCMPVLILALCLAIWLSYKGLQPNGIELQKHQILISGSYGMSLPFEKIASVEVVSELPSIRRKRHGYAMGDILKGEFRTESSELVRILADKRLAPYVKIHTTQGKQIYLTSPKMDAIVLSESIRSEIERP